MGEETVILQGAVDAGIVKVVDVIDDNHELMISQMREIISEVIEKNLVGQQQMIEMIGQLNDAVQNLKRPPISPTHVPPTPVSPASTAQICIDDDVAGHDRTQLYVAVLNTNAHKVRKLLEDGANPNIEDSDQWTPLHFAVKKGSRDIVQALLEHGADPSMKTKGNKIRPGKTALEMADNEEDEDILALLRERRS